jgi:hypothetical protein
LAKYDEDGNLLWAKRPPLELARVAVAVAAQPDSGAVEKVTTDG